GSGLVRRQGPELLGALKRGGPRSNDGGMGGFEVESGAGVVRGSGTPALSLERVARCLQVVEVFGRRAILLAQLGDSRVAPALQHLRREFLAAHALKATERPAPFGCGAGQQSLLHGLQRAGITAPRGGSALLRGGLELEGGFAVGSSFLFGGG
ncbi:unnamed protein product, partial [Discosporangium mesarthrocarpum]